jgi:hypothetical protein
VLLIGKMKEDNEHITNEPFFYSTGYKYDPDLY